MKIPSELIEELLHLIGYEELLRFRKRIEMNSTKLKKSTRDRAIELLTQELKERDKGEKEKHKKNE